MNEQEIELTYSQPTTEQHKHDAAQQQVASSTRTATNRTKAISR
jgi:hypothetical protein